MGSGLRSGLGSGLELPWPGCGFERGFGNAFNAGPELGLRFLLELGADGAFELGFKSRLKPCYESRSALRVGREFRFGFLPESRLKAWLAVCLLVADGFARHGRQLRRCRSATAPRLELAFRGKAQ